MDTKHQPVLPAGHLQPLSLPLSHLCPSVSICGFPSSPQAKSRQIKVDQGKSRQIKVPPKKNSAAPVLRRPGEGGFSIIELLLVVAILIALITIMGSRLTTNGRSRTMTQCQRNLQKIYLALSIYATDNKDAYPMVTNALTSEPPLSLLIPRCTTVTEMFICPASGDKKLREAESFSNAIISYAYYMGRNTNADPAAILASDRQLDTLPKLNGRQAFSTDGNKPGNNHAKDGGNLLFVNGETLTTGPKTSRDLIFPTNVVLLNPRSK